MILLFYGALLTIPFALNFIASRHDYARHVDALFASGMLAAIWAFTNAVGVIWDFPENKQFHPLVDLLGLSIAVAAYVTQRQRWKIVLATLFLAQLSLHAAFWAGQVYPPEMSGRFYVGLLNVLWLLQLVSVGAPGGWHVAVRACNHLRGDGGLPHPVRH